jgi:ATP-dependent DNA helicase RecG
MKENRFYEVKEQITNTFLKTVSAFANFSGGVIQFGISDNWEIVGVKDPKSVCLDIENRINDSIDPIPMYQLSIDEKTNVITLKVEEGAFKPYYYRGKAYKRNDTTTVEMDRIELNRLILEGEGRFFDELPSGDQNLKFSVLEEKMKKTLHISELNQDILKTIGLLDMYGRYNNAAALLADQNSFSGIDAARFGETIDVILDRETFENKSILKQYDEAFHLFQKYYQYEVIEGSVRKTVQKIPEKAFREAVANALVHRTWDIRSQIRIAMFDNRIEIFSPGGLPAGMTEKEYLGGRVSVLRNPVIGNVFFRMHIIESFGTGVRRMNQAYSDSSTKPSYAFTPNSITVILPVIQTVQNLTADEMRVYQIMSAVEKSSSRVIEETGFSKSKTLRLLSDLVRKGYIIKTGNGRGTRYSLLKP